MRWAVPHTGSSGNPTWARRPGSRYRNPPCRAPLRDSVAVEGDLHAQDQAAMRRRWHLIVKRRDITERRDESLSRSCAQRRDQIGGAVTERAGHRGKIDTMRDPSSRAVRVSPFAWRNIQPVLVSVLIKAAVQRDMSGCEGCVSAPGCGPAGVKNFSGISPPCLRPRHGDDVRAQHRAARRQGGITRALRFCHTKEGLPCAGSAEKVTTR